eukprot:711470-Alexandrium_andersonii.AAC.1
MPVEDVLAAGQRPVSANFARDLQAALGGQRTVYQIRSVAPVAASPFAQSRTMRGGRTAIGSTVPDRSVPVREGGEIELPMPVPPLS